MLPLGGEQLAGHSLLHVPGEWGRGADGISAIPRTALLLQKGVKTAAAWKENGNGEPQVFLQGSVPGMGSAQSAACGCGGIASYRAENSHVFAKQPSGQAGHLAA